jgi:hypothetical protein
MRRSGRNEGCQARNKIQWLEDHMGGAIPIRRFDVHGMTNEVVHRRAVSRFQCQVAVLHVPHQQPGSLQIATERASALRFAALPDM